ncbi:MAG: hypothetical protein KAH01_04425 [Caldisericia bacterium]|nr:hypothetical protein [Caldisericia bacterium]
MKTNWIGILIFIVCFYFATGIIMLNYHSKKQESVEIANSELIVLMEKFDGLVLEKRINKTATEELDSLIENAKEHIDTDKQAVEFENLLTEIEEFYLSIPNEDLHNNGLELKKKIVLHIKSMNDEIDYVLVSRSYFPFLKPFFNF